VLLLLLPLVAVLLEKATTNPVRYLLKYGLRNAASGPHSSTHTARGARYLQRCGKCCTLLEQIGGGSKRLRREVLALRLRQLLQGVHCEGSHPQLQGLNSVSTGGIMS
jgi:hypothetical protein